MNDIEEMAVQTFSLVPEAYQQIFIENGADFPDELVTAIKENPTQASQLLEKDKQLKNAVINIFKSNKQMIMQTAQQSQNKSKLFKVGGKLDYLLKLQNGGTTERSYKRVDGVNGSATVGQLANGTIYKVLSRRSPNGITEYTEQQITPRNDTTYYRYSNITPPIDRYVSGNRYVTPYKFQSMGKLIKLFNQPAPENWATKFDMYK